MRVTLELSDQLQNITKEEMIAALTQQIVLPGIDEPGIAAAVQQQIETALAKWVHDTLAGKSVEDAGLIFQPSNEWGEPRGKPMTLRELVIDKMASLMHARCDEQGRLGGSFPDDKRYVFAEWVIRKHALAAIEACAREAADKALSGSADKIVAIVTETIREKLAQQIKRR
jgi:hypothetical protein